MEKEAVKKLRKTTKGTTTIDLGKNIKPSQKLLNDAISFDQKDIAIGLQAIYAIMLCMTLIFGFSEVIAS